MRRLTVTVAALYLSAWAWSKATRWAHRQQAVWDAEKYLREVRA